MRRTSAVGWPAASAERIDDDAIIAVEARAHGQPIRIDDARAQELSLPAASRGRRWRFRCWSDTT